MKSVKRIIVALVFLTVAAHAMDQSVLQPVPFLEPSSLSNTVIHVSNWDAGVTCPPEYSNRLENTNLINPQQRSLLTNLLSRYLKVETNCAPFGTVLRSLYETNSPPAPPSFASPGAPKYPVWIAEFQHTNTGDREILSFSKTGLSAEYTSRVGHGYRMALSRTGSGTLLSFVSTDHGVPNGLAVRLSDSFHQGHAWDYRRARMTNAVLSELKFYTNGLIVGEYLLWNRDGRLLFHADFKEPYDLKRNQQLPRLGR